MIKILHIDNNDEGSLLLQEIMAWDKSKSDHQFVRVKTLKEAIKHLNEGSFDIIVSDLSLSDSVGVNTIKALISHVQSIPIIALIEVDDAEAGAEAMKNGAKDYLVKGAITVELFDRTVSYAMERKRNEEKIQKIIESAPNGLVLVDPNGKISLTNLAADYLFKVNRGEMIGKDIEMFIPKKFWHNRLHYGEEYWRQSELLPVDSDKESIAFRGDGSEFPIELGLSKIELEEGNYVLGAIVDITYRKQAEEALRESEKRFRLMADEAPVLIWMSDDKGHCEFFNKTWLEFTGKTFEDELGNGWINGVHPDDLKKCLEQYQSAVNDKKNYRMEFRLRNAAGEYGHILSSGTPRFDSEGRFLGFIGSCIDISDLVEIDRLKDEFVGNVSHELRTPLTIIRETISQMLDGVLGITTDEQKKFLKKSLVNIDRLRNMIDNLLDVAKIEAGRYGIEKKEENIVNIVKEVINDFEVSAGKKKLKLFYTANSKEIVISLDKEKIIQVLTNLIGNAIKFTKRGHVQVAVDEGDGTVECSISDTGEGISKRNLLRLFDKFQQIGKQNSSQEKGTGLGLSIVKGIIELHQGKMYVESAVGEGSKFTFVLPKK